MKKTGFTMVEMMIVLAIFGVLLTAGANFLISMMRNSNRSAIQNEVRQEASKIIQDIVQEVRSANSFTISNGDLIVSGITYHLDSSILKKNNVPISSASVIVSQFNVSSVSDSLVIVLTVQQRDESITLTDTVTPRSY